MLGKIALLRRREGSGAPDGRGFCKAKALHCQLFEPETLQICFVDARGDKNLAIICETDEPTIKQMISVWREEKTIHAIKALLGGLA